MGHAIAEALNAAGHTVAGDRPRRRCRGPGAGQRRADRLFQPAALEANLDAAVAAGKPILIGTTGLEERHHWLIDHASEKVAVLQTGNTSLGVNMLAWLVEEAARRLGEDWDIEIVETHHRMKVDAPRARRCFWAKPPRAGARSALKTTPCAAATASPASAKAAPSVSPRCAGQRGGDHTVHFLADNERLALSHLAENRGIFARGP
jgi:4-hydroxy-tetrahydrodipicolinate reductase